MCNDQAICDKKEICSVFNNFCINIGPSLIGNLDNNIDHDFSNDDIYSNIDFNPCTAFCNPITPTEIINIVSKLKNNESCDLDDVSVKLLKKSCSYYIISFKCNI